MLSMRVEPPKAGAGRVHRMSDDKPAPVPQKGKPMPKHASDAQKASVERNKQNVRIMLLEKIETGVRVRAHLAAAIGICRKTVSERCDEMVKDKLLRSRVIKGDKQYFVTAAGLLAIKQAGRN